MRSCACRTASLPSPIDPEVRSLAGLHLVVLGGRAAGVAELVTVGELVGDRVVGVLADPEAVEARVHRGHAALIGREALHVDLLAERQVVVVRRRTLRVGVDLGDGALGQTGADLFDDGVRGFVTDDGLDGTGGAVVRVAGVVVTLVGLL